MLLPESRVLDGCTRSIAACPVAHTAVVLVALVCGWVQIRIRKHDYFHPVRPHSVYRQHAHGSGERATMTLTNVCVTVDFDPRGDGYSCWPGQMSCVVCTTVALTAPASERTDD